MLNAKLRDAVYGLAVADALGVPYEFRGRGNYAVEGMVGGGAHDQPAGYFSDDTSMTLATCDSIRSKGGAIDCADMLERFNAWRRKGAYTPGGYCFDIGNATATALMTGRGCADEMSNGNGSLMRIVPLAFVDGVSDAQIEEVSAITHAHAISKRACVLYVRLAQDLLAGVPVRDALAKLPQESPYERLPRIVQVPREDIKSSGYVVHTLEAALWALATTNTYRDCVTAAIELGHDTDTVGAVAGALAGIVYGYDAIPAEWLEALCAKDVIEACLF